MIRNSFILFALAAFFLLNAANGPLPTSPLQQFRGWLELSEGEQEKALAEWPQDKAKVIREKLRAYRILPAEQRNRRLNMLELRWYLRPLMGIPAEQRNMQMQSVPPPIQPMIHARLQEWDKLDAKTRRDLLENQAARELVMAYFAQIKRGIPQDRIFSSMDQRRQQRLQGALEIWNRTPPDQRDQMAAQLASYLEMPRVEQLRTLQTFSSAEQEQIQKTLDSFASLPPEQRRVCVNSFQKFANMSSEERHSFLRNAARWQAMTSQERETWKQIVTKLPPMPPDSDLPPPLPPLTPRALSTN